MSEQTPPQSTVPAESADRPPVERKKSRLPAPIRAMRPKQWIKNILVVAAPMASGQLFDGQVALNTLGAFVAFSLISATVYLINDARDVEEDRLHPKKRFRPIAAGELSIPAALVLAGVCALIGFGLGFFISIGLGVTLAVYLVAQVLYSVLLKNQPVIDLAMVASGFLLRAVAGGVASDIELSQWFLLVASFGSLFMVGGKRYSEMVALGAQAGTRKSLQRYSDTYLRFVWQLSAAAVVMSFSLWAFEMGNQGIGGLPWAAFSIAPFVLAILRYAMDVDSGKAGEPEDVVMGDRVLQAFGLIFVVLAALAVLS